jgi:hypothetical protein
VLTPLFLSFCFQFPPLDGRHDGSEGVGLDRGCVDQFLLRVLLSASWVGERRSVAEIVSNGLHLP